MQNLVAIDTVVYSKTMMDAGAQLSIAYPSGFTKNNARFIVIPLGTDTTNSYVVKTNPTFESFTLFSTRGTTTTVNCLIFFIKV